VPFDPSTCNAFARDLALKIRYTLKNKDPLNADEDNVVRQRSTVYREERFKRLREFLGSCSYNSQLASWNLQLSVLENGEPKTDNRFFFNLHLVTCNCLRFSHPKRTRSWPEHCQDDLKQEKTVIP
jgi:hypothetical protein